MAYIYMPSLAPFAPSEGAGTTCTTVEVWAKISTGVLTQGCRIPRPNLPVRPRALLRPSQRQLATHRE